MTRTFISALFLLVACGGDGDGGEPCVEDEFACDGTILQQCVDGALTEIEDCADQGLDCHADMGHCMELTGTDMTGMEMR